MHLMKNKLDEPNICGIFLKNHPFVHGALFLGYTLFTYKSVLTVLEKICMSFMVCLGFAKAAFDWNDVLGGGLYLS